MPRVFTPKEAQLAYKTFGRKGIDSAVKAGFDEGLKWAVKYIKKTYFRSSSSKTSPSYIVSRTGQLRKSVRYTKAKKRSGMIWGELKMGTARTPYAAILEYGGRTKPHMIYPRRAGVLAFFWEKTGQWMFLKEVSHPGSVIEPRAPLGRGAARATPVIMKSVAKNLRRVAKKRLT